MSISLENFESGTSLNLTRLKEISLVFNTSPRSGKIYVDEISFDGSLSVDTFEDNDSTNDLGGASGTMSSGHSTVYISASYSGGDLILDYNIGTTWFNPGVINNVTGMVENVWGVITTPEGTVSSPGTFARVYMRARENASGVTTISLSNVAVYDADGKSLAVTVQGATINLRYSPWWDVNLDGVCNVGDLVVVGQSWRLSGSPGWMRADVNKDGVIDDIDMVLVAWHLGWSGG